MIGQNNLRNTSEVAGLSVNSGYLLEKIRGASKSHMQNQSLRSRQIMCRSPAIQYNAENQE